MHAEFFFVIREGDDEGFTSTENSADYGWRGR